MGGEEGDEDKEKQRVKEMCERGKKLEVTGR